ARSAGTRHRRGSHQSGQTGVSRPTHLGNVGRSGLAVSSLRRSMKFLRQTLAIAAKDLRSEIRGKEAVNASVSFALVILLLFSFAFDLEPEQIRDIAGGLLWLIFAFAGTLILNRSFARGLVNDCLDALLASPVSGAQLFFGKCLANCVLIIIGECISLPVYVIFYNVVPQRLALLFLVMLLGTWGITVIGTMFSAMTVN